MTDNEISRAALEAILASGVEYVLVGGLAVIAHTFARTTLDVDFVVAAQWIYGRQQQCNKRENDGG